MDETTLCELCGSEAIARLRSEWLCARCGLARATITTGPASAIAGGVAVGATRRWQRTLRTAIGSGLATKILIGAAAVAAVGGSIITNAPPDLTPPPTLPPMTTPVGPPAAPVPGELPPTVDQLAAAVTTPGMVPNDRGNADARQEQSSGATPNDVADYVAAIQEWNACVDGAVGDFATDRPGTSGRFNPFSACAKRPQPADYGLGGAPGADGGAGKPDDPGSQRNQDPGRPEDLTPPDDPGSQADPGRP